VTGSASCSSSAPLGYQRLARLANRCLGLEPRGVVELVDDVAVAGEGETGVVPELARDIDDAAALVEEQ